jgi:DNA invertase Pin-like site-specific DNA recombinase
VAKELDGRRVVLYARYSTEDQSPASIEDQLRKCREHVTRLGGVVADALVFSDAAMSGTSMRRPGLEALLAMATQKTPVVDVIVVEDVSRLSRDIADSATIFQRLAFARVDLIGVNDGVNTAIKGAKLMFTLRSAMNEAYIDELRERTLRGMEGRALAGYATGGVPYGYSTIEDRVGDRLLGMQIVVNEETAFIVRRIFAEYLAGRSLAMIAISLNKTGSTRHARRRSIGGRVGLTRGYARCSTMRPTLVGGSSRRSSGRRFLVPTDGRPGLDTRTTCLR